MARSDAGLGVTSRESPGARARRSEALFTKALDLLPGGVSSPVRAFGAVGGIPRFIERGEGPYLIDVDGHRYLDLVLSWGPLILGHAHPEVVRAMTAAAGRGTSFGAPSELELALAQRIVDRFPSIDLVRFVNSGTEAVMTAIRLARAATGRSRILKFEGCYHGHADALLAAAGSGVATFGLPNSPGVPEGAVADTALARFNDLAQAQRVFTAAPEEFAAIVVEPVAGNMGVVLPEPGFLEGLRQLTRTHGALLIFDEVMTGWRVHPVGAQVLYDITPDLTCLGKVMGGGLPAAAVGGRREVMDLLAPAGPVYQAGTLSGNPVAMAAGLATLDQLEAPGRWAAAERWAKTAAAAISAAAARVGAALVVQRAGTMLTAFFTETPVRDFDDASRTDHQAYARWFQRMLANGVYLPPSPFEAAFTSTVHATPELDWLERALLNAFV